MISYDFDYYKPTELNEAFELMKHLKKDGMKAIYYSGGTEIITSMRKGTIKADVVIDIKAISGISDIVIEGDTITMGACVSLNQVIESVHSSFIKDVLIRIADHTVRNAITLGGNICGRLPYKEAILPLLALGTTAILYSENGLREVKIRDIFDKRLLLLENEILYQLKFENKQNRYFVRRMTEGTKVDYPILNLCYFKNKINTFVGLSGFGSYPLYQLVDHELSFDKIFEHFSQFAKDDMRGSKEYKLHLLKTAMKEIASEQEVTND